MSLHDAARRLRRLFRKYGFHGGMKRILNAFRVRLFNALSIPALLRKNALRRLLRRQLAGRERVIVWRSSFGFRVPLYQRPQQMARQLARLGCFVVYEANRGSDGVDSFRLQEDGLLLFQFGSRPLRSVLLRELDRSGLPKVLQIYSTNYEMDLRELERWQKRGYQILYEYVDHLSPAISGTKELPKNVTDKYRYAMTHPEVRIVVTAELLRQDVLRQRGDRHLILASNGVDYAFFQQWEEFSFEPAFQEILDAGRPIVCYYGALASWVDYGILNDIAADGRFSLVLIGVSYDGSMEKELRKSERCFFLGPRDYRVLKYYARAADLLILPFRVNEITRSTNPVKLFEYMALYRPIVSTDIDECRKYRSVLIAESRADFIRQLEKALSLRDNADYLALLDREAKENDWSEKAKALIEGLQ